MPMGHVEVLRAACCLAAVDGSVCEKELPLLRKLAERAGVGQASLAAMMERAQAEPSYYEKQFEMLKTDPDYTIKALFCVAVADGVLEPDQRIILQYFADKLGMPQDRFDQILRAAEKSVAGNRK